MGSEMSVVCWFWVTVVLGCVLVNSRGPVHPYGGTFHSEGGVGVSEYSECTWNLADVVGGRTAGCWMFRFCRLSFWIVVDCGGLVLLQRSDGVRTVLRTSPVLNFLNVHTPQKNGWKFQGGA